MNRPQKLLCSFALILPFFDPATWTPSVDVLVPQGGSGEANFHHEENLITGYVTLESPNWRGCGYQRTEIVWIGGLRVVSDDYYYSAENVYATFCIADSLASEVIIDCGLLDGLGYVAATKN